MSAAKGLSIGMALVLAGCASSGRVDRGTLAAASTRELPLSYEVVAQGVEVRNCKLRRPRMYGWLLDEAIAAHPPANAIVDAAYSYDGDCFLLRGTAVRVTR